MASTPLRHILQLLILVTLPKDFCYTCTAFGIRGHLCFCLSVCFNFSSCWNMVERR